MKTKESVLSAQCLVLSAKKVLVTAALCAVGFAAFALPPSPYRDIWSSTPDPCEIKDPTSIIDWGMSSRTFESPEAKHGKFLEASADAMIAAYSARIAKDDTDCEAYICRAFAYLKKAGENQAFFDLAREFGYTFDNDTMHFTGELVHEKGVTPEMNDVSDEVCDILLPLMKSAYADLVTIPHNWKGCVAITPDVYPVDEAVYFDYADTLMAKAVLAEMMCILDMVKGFDVTMDSDLLEHTFDGKIPSLKKRGVQAILDNNPEFFSKVRDQKALTEAGDWWASAATLLDQWDKAHAKRSDGKPHFFDWNFEKLDSNGTYGVEWLRRQSQELANLPYWASPIDFTKINGDDHQFLSFKPIFGGKFLRKDFPKFGVGVKEPYCNEPLIDTCPDSTLCGIFVSSSPTYLASYISTRWTDIPPYTDNRTAPVYGIWYKNLFTEGGVGFENEGNPLWFAWDNANPIKLLDPEFNVRGVTAVFKGWSGVIHDGNAPITFEGSEIPTPIAQPMKYKDRRVELTANFDIPKVTYLDFDGTSGKLAERTDECELVTANTTEFTTGKVYAVAGNVTVANRITVWSTPENPAKLVLCDGATLWATDSVEVAVLGTATNALVICGQALGTGTLEATGGYNHSGIGGRGGTTGKGAVCGIVTINGGTVIAKGGYDGAGIGGGAQLFQKGDGGTVTINGGTVIATGGDYGAGIGGGHLAGGGTVTINGGTVTATGGGGSFFGAGIGAGYNGNSHGTVKFGAGIASGVEAGEIEKKYGEYVKPFYMTTAEYEADHHLQYVVLPCFSLKIPEAEGYSYAVSYEGAQLNAVLADGTNTYAIATGVTARVRFTLDEDHVWAKEPEDNPILIKDFSRDMVLGEGDLPTVKFVKKGSEENPWAVGYSTRDSVAAWTNETDKLVVEGAGNMEDFTEGNPAPWGTGISEVEIGEDVTSIGARAFADSQLGSVTIPASVTSIGAAAFFGSTSLSNVTVEAMTPPALGEGAFVELAEGYKIIVPQGTGAAYKAAPDWSLYADSIVEGEPGNPGNPWPVGTPNADDVTAYTNGVGGLVVEGEGNMRDFAEGAPWGTEITSVKIGEDVTGIGAKAFTDSQLGSATIPETVTNIGASAFADCMSLSNMVVEAMTPPALGADALSGCTAIETIYVPYGTGEDYKAAPGWSDFADRIVELPQPIAAESDEFTVDLRTRVELAEGETTISNITWSATLWGELDEEFVTSIGWTNLATGATGVFSNLARVVGDAAEDVDLPKKDGDYVLTHSTGDLKSFVTFLLSGTGNPVGSKENPWVVGPADDPEATVAWTDGDGTVYFKPPRSSVSREGLATITNAMGGTGFDMALVSADGIATNDVKMIIGAGGKQYTMLDEMLASDDDSFKFFDVTGCVVTYDGMGHSGTMAPDTFLPGVPTNLTANAFTAFGYVFQGWTTNGDTKVIFADQAEIADPQPGDVYDLKAVWKLTPVTVGKGVTARLDENGTLHIEGKGKMNDFTDANPAPWNEFADEITSVEIGAGVTKLGDQAFGGCENLAEVILASDATPINPAAFSADGETVENEPKLFVRNAEGGLDEVLEYRDPDDDTTVYDTLDDALDDGAEAVEVVTLPKEKAEAVAALTECAGEDPSEAVQRLLAEAIAAIEAAETISDVDSAARAGYRDITTQLRKETPQPIGDSDVTWRIADGELVIEGSGDMPDFDEANPAPWNEFADEITSVEIGEEVTHLGDAAFAVCPTNGEASVLFKDPEIDMNLGAFVSGDGLATNVPTVKVQVVIGDGRTLRVVPGGWTDADDPNVIYGSLAEAIENGVRAVTPAFEKKTDTGDVVIPPAEVEEIVIVTDGTGAKTELAAKFVNDANGLGSDGEVGLAADVENIAASVEALSSNIVVTVKLESSGTMDVALSNECESVKAGFAPDAATLGFVSHNFDIDVAWSCAGAGGELTELPASIVVHVPMKVYDGFVYSVSRLHGGAFEALPEWTSGTADSTTAEWFKVDVANGEIVIKTRLFCPYAIGVLELEKTCSVSVGNGDKYVGDRDPVSLPTNFTLTVTGPYNLSEFAGYAKRAYGESAGDYAINFVCVKMPDGFPAAGFGVKPGVFTIAERPDRIEPTGKVTYAKATKGNILYPSKPATWSAKPGLGSRFAGWEWIGEGAEPAGFHKLYENERRLTTLKFTVGKKERIAPKDFAAKWVRIDEDLLTDVWLSATNRLTTDSRSYVSMTIKGVPAGLKFVAKRLAFGGTAKKNGRFKVTVSAKNSSGYTLKQTGYLVVAGKKVVGYEPITTKLTGVPLMLWCDTTKGSVSGCGVFASGSTRKVNAKAKTGYVFAGWFSDPGFSTPAKFKGGKDHRIASQALVLKKPNYLFARFLPKTTTADPIVWLRYEGAGYCGAPASFLDEKETWYQGVRLPTNGCQIAFGSASLPAVSVKGLPAGVTFDKKTLRFKGSPTRAGTFTVKVTVKNQSASTDVLTRKVVVKALPKWLVGTFDGISLGLDGEGALVENGITTVTVGSTGKISGKTVVKGKASAFKTTSFTSVMLDGDDLVYVLGTRTFAQSAETGLGEYVYIVNGLERAWAVQRGWTRKDLALALPVFPTGTKALKLSETAEDGSVIKFTFGAYGVIKVAGKVPGKGGKLVSISGSCRVLPTGMNTVQDAPEKPERLAELLADTCVNIAPTKTLPAGFCAVEPLAFTVNSSNKVTAVADPSAD